MSAPTPQPPDSGRIDDLQRQGAADPDAITFGGGLPASDLFPQAQLAALSAKTLSEHGESVLQYGWPEGDERLRQWVAAHLARRGARVPAEDVIITSGAQQAINLAAEILAGDCSSVGVDRATYAGALSAFRSHDVPLLPLDDPAACFLYTMPGMHNPLGTVMSDDERQRLLADGRTIVEDDAYADLVFAERPATPLLAAAPDRIWHIGTFSKTICPGLRVGWLIVPHRYRQDVVERKSASDIQASGLAQAMLSEFLPGDDFEARLERARRFYRAQAGRLMAALRRHLPSWRFHEPAGGFSLWVETPAGGAATDLLAAAVAHGVAFDPGEMFCPFGCEPLSLRLCYSNVAPERIDEGVRRLAAAWRDFTRTDQGRAA